MLYRKNPYGNPFGKAVWVLFVYLSMWEKLPAAVLSIKVCGANHPAGNPLRIPEMS